MLFFFVLGDILGGGIYALVGVFAGDVGGAIWAAFLVALLLAVLTGDLGALADTTVLLLLGVFIAVNVSALRLRGDRVGHPHFEVPRTLSPARLACSPAGRSRPPAGARRRRGS